MADIKITGETYTLRAGAPMPVSSNNFVTQTFMAERSTVDTYLYTNTITSSDDFRGRGGDYMEARFSRLLDVGGESFSGSVTHSPVIVDESTII